MGQNPQLLAMQFLPASLTTLMDELSRLPGIGPKSAQRLAFYLLKQSQSRLGQLGSAISDAKEGVLACEQCYCLTDQPLCTICNSAMRDKEQLCIVEGTLDMLAIERTGEYKGLYHVLGGRLSPLHGIGPGELKVAELFSRLTEENSPTKEIILALNPDLEGDTTALFLQNKLSSFSALHVTRIARGIPSGGNLCKGGKPCFSAFA